jgi:hypothetical protein
MACFAPQQNGVHVQTNFAQKPQLAILLQFPLHSTLNEMLCAWNVFGI